jgi:alpha-beta hydrolase superfamily lysophospholipase
VQVEFHSQAVGGVEVFYRVAGRADAPVVLLLHGFPTASHMFRDLIPELAQNYRVIAPDLPGFGNTVAPPRGAFTYSFDRLAQTIGDFNDRATKQRARPVSGCTVSLKMVLSTRFPQPGYSESPSIASASRNSKCPSRAST